MTKKLAVQFGNVLEQSLSAFNSNLQVLAGTSPLQQSGSLCKSSDTVLFFVAIPLIGAKHFTFGSILLIVAAIVHSKDPTIGLIIAETRITPLKSLGCLRERWYATRPPSETPMANLGRVGQSLSVFLMKQRESSRRDQKDQTQPRQPQDLPQPLQSKPTTTQPCSANALATWAL